MEVSINQQAGEQVGDVAEQREFRLIIEFAPGPTFSRSSTPASSPHRGG